jgi:hypothetical protein
MIEVIKGTLLSIGLCLRGAPVARDDRPGSLLLVGFLGRSLWPHFQAARRDEADPFDAWTKRVLDPLAQQVGAEILYPFEGPPWHPFQRWAMRAEGLAQSPVGPLIHPVYGLWHGYRAALVFKQPLHGPTQPPAANPCLDCQDRPCLTACPAGVFDQGRYDLPACLNYLKQGANPCVAGGCLARRGCPVGAAHAYAPEQAAFHTRAFLNAMDRFS